MPGRGPDGLPPFWEPSQANRLEITQGMNAAASGGLWERSQATPQRRAGVGRAEQPVFTAGRDTQAGASISTQARVNQASSASGVPAMWLRSVALQPAGEGRITTIQRLAQKLRLRVAAGGWRLRPGAPSCQTGKPTAQGQKSAASQELWSLSEHEPGRCGLDLHELRERFPVGNQTEPLTTAELPLPSSKTCGGHALWPQTPVRLRNSLRDSHSGSGSHLLPAFRATAR